MKDGVVLQKMLKEKLKNNVYKDIKNFKQKLNKRKVNKIYIIYL